MLELPSIPIQPWWTAIEQNIREILKNAWDDERKKKLADNINNINSNGSNPPSSLNSIVIQLVVANL